MQTYTYIEAVDILQLFFACFEKYFTFASGLGYCCCWPSLLLSGLLAVIVVVAACFLHVVFVVNKVNNYVNIPEKNMLRAFSAFSREFVMNIILFIVREQKNT